jgi:hypothetical protein
MDVSHEVLPHCTMPGSHAAPPSGALHVEEGVVLPLLAPPSSPALAPASPVAPTAPDEPLAVPLPVLLPAVVVPLALPVPVPPLSLPPPLAAPLPSPLPDGFPLAVPGFAVELLPLHCVSASGPEADTITTPTIHACVVFIEVLLIKAQRQTRVLTGPIAARELLPSRL